MSMTSIAVNRKNKEKIVEIKERTRTSTINDMICVLLSLYEQVTSIADTRAEEIEIVESIENGTLLNYLKRKLCEEEVEKGIEKQKEGIKKKISI